MSIYKGFMISLMPHASLPMELDPEEYNLLVKTNKLGWSVCQTQKEWLAKLHYLRNGLIAGKIDQATFQKKEKALVVNWWKRFL